MSDLPVDLEGGEEGHVDWHNQLHNRYNLSSVHYVNNFTGTFGERMDSALAEAHSQGGLVVIDPGVYTDDLNHVVSVPYVSVDSSGGSAAAVINYTGTGPWITWSTVPFTVRQQGSIGGIELTGDGSDGQIGIHCLDTGTVPAMHDMVVQAFSGDGSIGVLMENTDKWNERANINRVHLNDNTVGLELRAPLAAWGTGASSFGYHRWIDLRVNINAGQIGIKSSGGAYIYNGVLSVICNAEGTGGKLFDVDGVSTWGCSIMVTGETFAFGDTIGIHVHSGASFTCGGVFSVLGMIFQNDNPEATNNAQRATLRVGLSTPLVMDAGSMVDFAGGEDARIIPWTGSPSPYNVISSFGHLEGPGISSAYVGVYEGTGNAFVVYRVAYGQSLADATELFRIASDGRVTLQGALVVEQNINCDQPVRTGRYPTADRPSAATYGNGATIYDINLSKPITSDGTIWRDAMGNAV